MGVLACRYCGRGCCRPIEVNTALGAAATAPSLRFTKSAEEPLLHADNQFAGLQTFRELLEAKTTLEKRLPHLLPAEVSCNVLLLSLYRRLIAPDPGRRFQNAEAADLGRNGAAPPAAADGFISVGAVSRTARPDTHHTVYADRSWVLTFCPHFPDFSLPKPALRCIKLRSKKP